MLRSRRPIDERSFSRRFGSEPVYTFQDIQFTDRDVIRPHRSTLLAVQRYQRPGAAFPIEHCLRFLVAEDPDQYLTIWRDELGRRAGLRQEPCPSRASEDYDPETLETGLAQMAQAGDLLAPPPPP